MRDKKIVYFFSALLLFSGLLCSVDALSDTTVSFRGGGVTIDLTYPDESKPNTTITHTIMVTANTAVTLLNFTVVIKAPVNSSWQVVFADKLPANWYLAANTTLEWPIQTDPLPEEANGKLSCFMNVSTDQSTHYATYTFYTTHVSDPTLSEMQSLYYDMLANYSNYETLVDEYDTLLAKYNSSLAAYETLLSQYNDLSEDYNSQVAIYASLLNSYNKLSDDYDDLDANYRSKISELGALQTDYDELNSTRYNLQASYDTLQAIYDGLNNTYTNLLTDLSNLQERINSSENALNSDRIVMFIFIVAVAALIAFIVYLKRKKEEPYVVIRKETVNVKKEGS
jgi:hypothetical protein